MKRVLSRIALAALLAIAPAAIYACGSSSTGSSSSGESSSSGGETSSSGGTSGDTASSGGTSGETTSSGGTSGDTTSSGGATTTPEPTPAPTPAPAATTYSGIVYTNTQFTTPAAGVSVVINDASGAITLTTGADGTFSTTQGNPSAGYTSQIGNFRMITSATDGNCGSCHGGTTGAVPTNKIYAGF
ncbi:MAG: hypothetical protein HZB29_12835 [Nitrospinae bacterium]|nr:hypothetical protein [Nitrospinota bacterium]